jgi:long-chain acyl-CoA synthetase
MHVDAIMYGVRIGYSSGDIKNLIKDIQMLRPTIFGSFPGFFTKIYEKINENIENRSQFMQNTINTIIQDKIFEYIKTGNYRHKFWDNTLFYFFRNLLGGRVRWMISGGAPLRSDIQKFLTVVFNTPIFQALGATEVAGCLTCTSYWDRTGDHCGGPLPCIRIQLRDIPELGFSTDGEVPRGELFVKGNSVFKGYYKNPELTKQVLSEDGWLTTGDVAELKKNGAISLIDRIREMKKLQNG